MHYLALHCKMPIYSSSIGNEEILFCPIFTFTPLIIVLVGVKMGPSVSCFYPMSCGKNKTSLKVIFLINKIHWPQPFSFLKVCLKLKQITKEGAVATAMEKQKKGLLMLSCFYLSWPTFLFLTYLNLMDYGHIIKSM